MSNVKNMAAYNVKVSDVYHPKVRPGYACWVYLWRSVNGELRLAFGEKRRAKNPSYRPIPLDFEESMVQPIKYQITSPDVINESVIMKSDDEGATWKETGRSESKGIMYAFTSTPDGTILNGFETSYLSFTRAEIPITGIQKSTDGGNTWRSVAILLDGKYFGYPYRLRRLSDGVLVLICSYWLGFGPGRPRLTRQSKEPHLVEELRDGCRPSQDSGISVGCWISQDNGTTWHDPLIVLPGIIAPEPDFVELPSGDLLVLNSTIQGGPAVRQYVYRTKHGFIPGPVYKVVSGQVPETVCVAKSGLLVGATRCRAYTCSNDDGATWHEISGMPKCEYQPQIIELKDGRFLCAWHMFGDCVFGQHHQFVGQHVFRLRGNLPSVTKLELTRDLNKKKTRYINAYTVHLSSGKRNLPKKRIKFWIHARYRDTYDLRPPAPEPWEVYKMTDKSGKAHIHLAGFDKEINIHQGYEIKAYFIPSKDGQLAPAESHSYFAYGMTPEKGIENNYPLYVAEGKVFVCADILKSFHEIKDIVGRFGKSRRFKRGKIKRTLGLSDARLDKIIKYLVSRNLFRVVSPAVLEWKYQVSGVELMKVKDDFV